LRIRHGKSFLQIDEAESLKYWSRILFLNGQALGLLALFIAIFGQILVKPWPLNCRETTACLDALVGLCQAYLFVYGWSFLGYDQKLTCCGRSFLLYRRFDNLGFVLLCYADFIIGSIILLSMLASAVATENDIDNASCASIRNFSILVLILSWSALIVTISALAFAILHAPVKPSLKGSLDNAKAMTSNVISFALKRISNRSSFAQSEDKEEDLEAHLRRQFGAFGDIDSLDLDHFPELFQRLNLDPMLIPQATEAAERGGLIRFIPFYEWYQAQLSEVERRDLRRSQEEGQQQNNGDCIQVDDLTRGKGDESVSEDA